MVYTTLENTLDQQELEAVWKRSVHDVHDVHVQLFQDSKWTDR